MKRKSEKCYLCRKEFEDHDDDSWYINMSERVPMCTKCTKIIGRKFRAWVRSLRPKKKGKKK